MKSITVAIAAVFLTAFSFPDDPIVVDVCSHVEINHVYNIDDTTGEASLRMVQYIWWEWRNYVLLPEKDVLEKETGSWKRASGFIVREYLVTYSGRSRPENTANVLISKEGNKYICIFWDKDDRVLRRVVCNWTTETHTEHDVEIENRNIISIESRNKFQKR